MTAIRSNYNNNEQERIINLQSNERESEKLKQIFKKYSILFNNNTFEK